VTSTAAQEVRAALDRWARAIEAADLAGVLAERAEDVVLFDASPPLEARGIDAYRAAWELFFSFQGAGTFRLGELEVVADRDVAFAHGIVTVGPLDPAGQFPVRLTVGLARRHGRWLVTHEHHSVLSP